MDVISLVVSIIGTIVTIASAIYAYKQAEKAEKSANEAELVRQSIEREQIKIELGKLLNSTKSIIEQTILLTTPANPVKKVRGLNYDSTISSLRRYIDTLKENCHYLPKEKENKIIIEYKKVESFISELVNENNQQNKYKVKVGDKIHICIGELLRIIKPETDIK